jgi:predicted alpha/beta hydrolase family esterase
VGRGSTTATNCLIVPGLKGSGPDHWQTLWEHERSDCTRVELGCWAEPIRSIWLSQLDRAIMASPGPAVIVAHSLGCLATIWWAAGATASATARVKGALLVAPPDVEKPDRLDLLAPFAPEPDFRLPFPALLVASRNDPYATFARQAAMARRWGCDLVDAGECGHINADSNIGNWIEGQILLDALIAPGPSSLPHIATGAPPAPHIDATART